MAAFTSIALGVFVLLTILGVPGHRTASDAAATPAPTPLAEYEERAPHVLSAVIVYALQGGVSGATQAPVTQIPPLAPSAFTEPVATYLRYAEHQLELMEPQIATLETALEGNDRAGAESAWRGAYSDYLRLGATYLTGEVSTLNQQINGNAGGLPGGVANPDFAGLHRLEYALWTGLEPRSQMAWARRLATDVHTLRGVLGHVSITPLEYATRAHEILEDAIRDLLSGVDVPWSHEGVLATSAGLEATEEVVATLKPLLKGREGVTQLLEAELPQLRAASRSLADDHAGALPSDTQLSQSEAESLENAVGGALDALAQVPGALETEPTPQIEPIPGKDKRVDP